MNTTSNSLLIELSEVGKSYTLSSGGIFRALQNINLKIESGQLVAITGKSGSGKTTLLNILAGIDRSTAGRVMVNGSQIDRMSERQLAPWRGSNIGVVFQFFQLLPTLTIAENVMLPMDFCNTFHRSARRKRALQLLEMVDVAEQADKLPSSLSGGQQQRAAIARALANDPPILIADEPTGNLDSSTAQTIFQLFINLSRAGKTVIVVTHERELAEEFDVVFEMKDGAIAQSSTTKLKVSL
ncbi:MAG: ABC transporter ATP-binding protein [Chryseolinea sp.]